MTPNRPFDQSIPVLTEVIQDSPADLAMTVPAPAPENDPGAQLEAQAASSWNDDEWSSLERRLTERILHQLQGRVDFVLEQRIKDCMAEVLQRALSDLTSEIQNGLQQTMEKIVSRAVAQELAHLQALKK